MKSYCRAFVVFCLAALMLIVLCASAMATAQWDGKLSDKNFAQEEFANWTVTTVYQSDDSVTGYNVSFRYYGPEETRVRVGGEWYFTEQYDSSVYTAGRVLPENWHDGLTFFTDDGYPAARPFYDMVLDKKTGYWEYTLPLPSGTYCYQFLIGGKAEDDVNDVSNGRLTADPSNRPIEMFEGRESYSQVYMPYDPVKQAHSRDYSLQAPRADGQTGTISYFSVTSQALSEERAVGIYLPYGYDPSLAGGYPVLYLLHGGAGYESNWFAQGVAGNILDTLIAEGTVKPMIVVTPMMRDANGTYADRTVEKDGKAVGSGLLFVVNDLMPYIEKNYNVSTEASGRACAGLSAGGRFTSALYYSYPQLFDYYGIWSSCIEVKDLDLDFSRNELQGKHIQLGGGLYDEKYYDLIVPMQKVLAENKIAFTTDYVWGGHRWNVWRDNFVDLCTRVLWK